MTTPYTMPEVELGETVVWKPNYADQIAVPAIVTHIGSTALSVALYPPGNKGAIPKDGVRFHQDPDLNRIVSDSGVWDYSGVGKRLRQLEAGLIRAQKTIK